MSIHSRRIQTLKVLVTGSPISNSSRHIAILGEFNSVDNVNRVNGVGRRLLLQVLHSTRAIDTSLRAFVVQRGVSTTEPKSIGKALMVLKDHKIINIGRLSKGEHDSYYRGIAKPRNRYMHQAGAYPGDANEVLRLLGEMESCLTRVITL